MTHKKIPNECPYCKAPLEVCNCDEIKALNYKELKSQFQDKLVLKCSNYPKCDSYVVFPQTMSASERGVVANKFLRNLRSVTHRICDLIWKTGMVRGRDKLYELLSKQLKINSGKSHIRFYDLFDCIDAILFAFEYINAGFPKINFLCLSKLDEAESDMLRKIVKTEFTVQKKYDFSKNDLETILSIIYNDDVKKVFNVNINRSICSFIKNREIVVYSYEGTTLHECVKSITVQLYNDFAHMYGFPKINKYI